jgi:anti-sigma-K factor RskA
MEFIPQVVHALDLVAPFWRSAVLAVIVIALAGLFVRGMFLGRGSD